MSESNFLKDPLADEHYVTNLKILGPKMVMRDTLTQAERHESVIKLHTYKSRIFFIKF